MNQNHVDIEQIHPLMRRGVWAKPVAVFRESRIPFALQSLHHRLLQKPAFDAEEWPFPTAQGTTIHYMNFLRRVWYRVPEQAKLRRRTPHDLRHTWASHMLAAGADLAYVSSQLGHSNPATTL